MKPLEVPRDQWPLYVPIDDAAAYAGVSKNTMKEWVEDRVNPIRQLHQGVKKTVCVDSIASYAASKSIGGDAS